MQKTCKIENGDVSVLPSFHLATAKAQRSWSWLPVFNRPCAMRRLQCGHPLNVFPLGNAFLDDSAQQRRSQGLGNLQRLGDERLLQLLRWLDISSLGRCCQCSCMMRGFAAAEELWQPLVMNQVLAAAGSENCCRDGFNGFSCLEFFGGKSTVDHDT